MNENQSSDTLINQIYNILSDLSKKWQIILLITVVCALGFDTYKSITYVPMYRSEATYAVKSYYGYGANDAKQDIGETFSYIFSSNVFKNKIEKELGVEKLDGVFKAEHLKDTNVLRVYAESSSIRTSYEMMKALQVYYSDLSNLVVGKSNIDVLQELSIPSSPYNGFSHKRNIVKVGFIAFVLSAGFFAFLSIVNDTLKDKTEVEKKLNLRLLGSLPIESKIINWKNLKRKKAILISQYSTSFNYVESLKKIRSKIEGYAKKHHAKVFMVTSSLENEGKSSVAVNLALVLAKNNHKVLLIDGDLRKSSLHLIFDIEGQTIGIHDVLNHKAQLSDAIQTLDNYKIDVLFGNDSSEATYDTASNEMKNIIKTVKQEYDYVIVDTAPSRFLSDSRILAADMDGIILVVRQNFAKVSLINDTIEKLDLSNTPIIGTIINRSYSSKVTRNHEEYGYNNKRHNVSRRREE